MKMTSIDDLKAVHVKISPRQVQLLKLYIKAHGKAVVWVRNGKLKILEPDEVMEVME